MIANLYGPSVEYDKGPAASYGPRFHPPHIGSGEELLQAHALQLAVDSLDAFPVLRERVLIPRRRA